jgi:Leucine-rich repeat (LRR) protein/predicted acylesterase/phospholipase RssA
MTDLRDMHVLMGRNGKSGPYYPSDLDESPGSSAGLDELSGFDSDSSESDVSTPRSRNVATRDRQERVKSEKDKDREGKEQKGSSKDGEPMGHDSVSLSSSSLGGGRTSLNKGHPTSKPIDWTLFPWLIPAFRPHHEPLTPPTFAAAAASSKLPRCWYYMEAYLSECSSYLKLKPVEDRLQYRVRLLEGAIEVEEMATGIAFSLSTSALFGHYRNNWRPSSLALSSSSSAASPLSLTSLTQTPAGAYPAIASSSAASSTLLTPARSGYLHLSTIDTALNASRMSWRAGNELVLPSIVAASVRDVVATLKVGQDLRVHGLHALTVTSRGLKLNDVPYGLERAASLVYLSLAHHHIQRLPPDFAQLVNLRYIDLSDNHLADFAPVLFSFARCEVLLLEQNALKVLPSDRSLTPSWSSLSALRILNLSSNLLSSVPPSIGDCPSLEKLLLTGNPIRNFWFVPLLDKLMEKFNQAASPTEKESEKEREKELQVKDLGGHKDAKDQEQHREQHQEQVGNMVMMEEEEETSSVAAPAAPPTSSLFRLSVLELSYSKLSIGSLDTVCASFLSSLTVLVLRKSGLTSLTSSLSHLSCLQYLDISQNALSALWAEHLPLGSLEVLLAHRNKIKTFAASEGRLSARGNTTTGRGKRKGKGKGVETEKAKEKGTEKGTGKEGFASLQFLNLSHNLLSGTLDLRQLCAECLRICDVSANKELTALLLTSPETTHWLPMRRLYGHQTKTKDSLWSSLTRMPDLVDVWGNAFRLHEESAAVFPSKLHFQPFKTNLATLIGAMRQQPHPLFLKTLICLISGGGQGAEMTKDFEKDSHSPGKAVDNHKEKEKENHKEKEREREREKDNEVEPEEREREKEKEKEKNEFWSAMRSEIGDLLDVLIQYLASGCEALISDDLSLLCTLLKGNEQWQNMAWNLHILPRLLSLLRHGLKFDSSDMMQALQLLLIFSWKERFCTQIARADLVDDMARMCFSHGSIAMTALVLHVLGNLAAFTEGQAACARHAMLLSKLREHGHPTIATEAKRLTRLLGFVDMDACIVERRGIRILALDGGGMRGVVTGQILQHLESHLQVPIGEAFDLIVGTSTGGFIAFAIGLMGKRGSDLEEMYRQIGEHVFLEADRKHASAIARFFNTVTARGLSRYSSEKFDAILGQLISTRRVIRFADRRTRVAALATCASNTPGTPFLFRNYNYAGKTQAAGVGFDGTAAFGIPISLHASAAAPSYFSEVKLKHRHRNRFFQDGGIVRNNPAFAAMTEARAIWGDDYPIACLVSIGTGAPPVSEGKHAKRFVGRAFKLLVDSSTETAKTHEILEFTLPKNVYYRFNPVQAIYAADLDECEPEVLTAISQATQDFMEEETQLQRIQMLCKQMNLKPSEEAT